MNKYSILTVFTLLLLTLTTNAAPPNVVIFISDDQGTGDLSCYGHPTLKTPNIDRLAREGALFTHAFLTISSCSPSRCSILTGKYPHNTNAEDLHQPLPADQTSIAQHLKTKDYHNVAIGKWHLGPHERKHWDNISECSGADTGNKALEQLRKRPNNKPFFFWIASKDPHRPFALDDIKPTYTQKDAVIPPYLPDHPDIRKEIAQYYDEIARFDTHVGQVLDTLKKQNALDNTIIFYISDNGMPFPRAKTTLYDAGIRTPFLVRYPPLIKPGVVRRQLTSTIDIAPTIMQLTDLKAPQMQGKSLLPVFKDEDAPHRNAIFAEANWHDFEKFTRAVRTERYLLIRNYYWDKPLWNSVDSVNSITWRAYMQMHRADRLTPAQKFLFLEPRPYEEFYDLQLDPQSLNNQIHNPQHTAQLNHLRILLDNWRVNTNDTMPEQRVKDGWTRDGRPLPHNQPWYDRYKKAGGKSSFENF